MRIRILVLGLVLGPSFAISAQHVSSEGQATRPESRIEEIPIVLENVPLTAALGRVGVADRGDFVLFGIEVETLRGDEPLVSARIRAGSTLKEAVAEIIQSVNGYSFEMVSPHLINVYSVGAKDDPKDALNVRIPQFNLSSVSPSSFISNPPRYVPELALALSGGVRKGCTIGPGLSDKAPGIFLRATDITVRQALNLVAQASIDAAIRNGAPAFGWVYLREQSIRGGYPSSSWRVHDVWDPSKHRPNAQ